MAEWSPESQIQEGFLCPVCYKDLRSPGNLLSHFVELHSEEQDLLKSIKDLVGKAKKKILKLDENELESFKTEMSLQKIGIEYSEPQAPGQTRSMTEYFRNVRRERLDHRTSETNRLIIRLDKLLRIDGPDRKLREQELVVWLDGSTVSRCPSCTASFNITRRQHHCRLCGSIMCNSCSYFLPYEIAKTIVAPVYSDTNKANAIASKAEGDTLRLCAHCMNMLDSRNQAQMLQVNQPVICQLYMRLQKIKNDLQPSLELYDKMYNSMMSGEQTFRLQDVQSLRSSIAQQAEILDAISKRIISVPLNPEQPKAILLQNSIRRATTQYIKEYLLVLPILPSAEELYRIRQERLTRNVSTSTHPTVSAVKKIAVTTGWSPDNLSIENVIPEISDEDPLMQQIAIVRNYIKQARSANRFEEVASLEENLEFLKKAYREQQLAFKNDKVAV
ncbi:hypothetical protein RN001_000665 [Aquatica leii]|uniref:Rabenosyn-5 n=1 Tax=Aquatica leii TaxID=1421715 RepID=A0AAN7PF82_9COLE|nr:hypothetical protein RN001_000665 [Aquatica leii]